MQFAIVENLATCLTSWFLHCVYILQVFEKCFDRYKLVNSVFFIFLLFFDLFLLKYNFATCLLLKMYISVFIPIISRST